MKQHCIAALSALTLVALGSPAHAVVVNIDATTSGCDFTHCAAVFHQPGDPIGAVFNPTQLTLGPGTYTVTNGSGMPGSNPNFSAWRVNGGNNWNWNFLVIDDAALKVVMFGCCNTVPNVGPTYFTTQAAAAAQPYAQNFSANFTLAAMTTLDFVTEDYFPADNAGGMSLKVAAAVPEPSSWALLCGGLLAVGFVGRNRWRSS